MYQGTELTKCKLLLTEIKEGIKHFTEEIYSKLERGSDKQVETLLKEDINPSLEEIHRTLNKLK